jgi:SAM-dependent methyltransferase
MKNTGFPDAANVWNSRYDRPDFLFGSEPNAFLASHQTLFVKGKKALAVADGEGRNSVWLARQGLLVDAFDISSVGVAKAKEYARTAHVGVNFHVCDCDSWDWQPAAYDYVVAIFVQFAGPQMRQRLFANMVSTLKPGGYLVLQGYTPKQLEYKTGGPPEVSHLYTEGLLKSSFKGVEFVELRSYEAEIEEGAQHRGRSALIGMVARMPV